MSKTFKGETLVGQKFNKWIVLEFIPNDKRASYWLCQCSCESKTKKIVEGGSLKQGKSKSCGCLQKEKVIKDLTGQSYGKLKIIRQTELRDNNGSVIWECRCNCGNLHNISTKHWGETQSCGHCGYILTEKLKSILNGKNSGNALDLTNKRFGKLVVIEPTERRSNNSIVWKCKCDCGLITYGSSSNLIREQKQSCGCLKSIGEMNINKVLIENDIDYISEYTFEDLLYPDSNRGPISFDFAIFNNDKLEYLIEFDGLHHVKAIANRIEKFEKTQKYDKLRNKYCLENNIPLIRLPYKLRNCITLELCRLKNNPYIIKEV